MDLSDRQQRRRRPPKRIAVLAAFAVTMAVTASAPVSAHTGTTHAAYPNHGWAWMAQFPDTRIWLKSERCSDAGVADAIIAIDNTTSGSRSEFRGAWPSGIEPYQEGCGSTVNNSTDILLDFMTDAEWDAAHSSVFGGHVHSQLATTAWCDYWGFRKIDGKCGLHPSRIHIRTSRYLNYSSTTRRNFLVHETGHSFGFVDSCADDNRITNNTGGSGCSLPSGWVSVDRQEMRDHIYPNWRY